jgi:hypothetical protein
MKMYQTISPQRATSLHNGNPLGPISPAGGRPGGVANPAPAYLLLSPKRGGGDPSDASTRVGIKLMDQRRDYETRPSPQCRLVRTVQNLRVCAIGCACANRTVDVCALGCQLAATDNFEEIRQHRRIVNIALTR